MRCCPGISWGYDAHINLIRSSIGWLALYYDDPESRPDIIAVFNPKNYGEYYAMMRKMTFYNYNTERLCPYVKADIDGTS